MSRFEGETKGVPRSALGLAAVGFRCRRLGGVARRGENATRRAAIDSDARWGYTYQYNRRGRNVTVGAKKKSGLPSKKPDTAHANCSLSVIKERIFQSHKKLKITLSPLVILLRCALSRSRLRRLSGGSPIDKPTGRCPTLRPPHPPSLSRREKQHDFRTKVHSFSSEMHHLSPLPHTRATRHAPSHPRFSRGEFFAFTLHLHIYHIDLQTFMCEHYPRFLLHRGEGKGGEAFTLITLLSNDLRTTGEEVKAKNEKRRTRPRARKTPKNGVLSRGGARHLSCRTDHLGEAPSGRKDEGESCTLFRTLPNETEQNKTRN